MVDEPTTRRAQDDAPTEPEPMLPDDAYRPARSQEDRYWNDALAQDVRALGERIRRLRERDLLD